MKKFGLIATAAVVGLTAATATFGIVSDAEAGHRRHHNRDVLAGAALGIAGGILLGQALAPQPSYGYGYGAPVYAAPPVYAPQPRVYYRPRPVYVQPRVVYDDPVPVYRHRARGYDDAHVEWCSRRFRSYNAYDNTWVSYSGRVNQCVSPYSY